MKSDRMFGKTGLTVSPLGLGCSRLGSVLGASADEAKALLTTALDNGVIFFDTADIYAQGESERLIGSVVGKRSDVVICTKVGKHLPLAKRMLLPFKSLIRRVADSSQSVRQGVRQSRAKGMPTDWTPEYLGRAIDRSLKRLGRERIDVLMLHSPGLTVIRAGDALGALAKSQASGKVGVIGLSVDDLETAEAALSDERVQALQLPLHPNSHLFDEILLRAHEKGVAVVAREILGGPNVIGPSVLRKEAVAARVSEVAAMSGVSVTLVGTTKARHLIEAIEPFGLSRG